MAVNLSPIPARSPLVNQDGTMSPIWVGFFQDIFRRVGQTTALSNTELGNGIDGLSSTVQGQLTSLDSRVDALEALPPNQALPSYTVATVPSASANARKTIWVSNASGGAFSYISNGTNWLRTSNEAVLS